MNNNERGELHSDGTVHHGGAVIGELQLKTIIGNPRTWMTATRHADGATREIVAPHGTVRQNQSVLMRWIEGRAS